MEFDGDGGAKFEKIGGDDGPLTSTVQPKDDTILETFRALSVVRKLMK
ncbi:hypothetical protein BDW_03640 [Bdellovibrio bacteriovorus W]|nr:hypothetical protein BDW_03640 [Bdellovibrio bacteriovorus W]